MTSKSHIGGCVIRTKIGKTDKNEDGAIEGKAVKRPDIERGADVRQSLVECLVGPFSSHSFNLCRRRGHASF